MKSKVLLAVLFMSFTAMAVAQDAAPRKICFTDDAGYVWKFDNVVDNGDWTYYATGMVENAYPSTSAYMKLDFRAGRMNGTVIATAVNNNPDGCTMYSDSFVYRGSAMVMRSGELTSTYSGSGSWESYCFGGVINMGSWSAWGPCARGVAPKIKQGVLPAMGKQASGNLKAGKLAVTPNPIKNFASISYKVAASGNVNITVFNMMQQPVKVLVNERKSEGTYTVNWNGLSSNGAKVPTGLYRVVAVIGSNVTSVPVQVE